MKLKVVGITGGIGAGKSVVSRVLRCNGYEVYDCDLEARKLMDSSVNLKEEIKTAFGLECVTPEGELVREKIAEHVFGNDEKRRWLNQRVHAMVRDHIADRIHERQIRLNAFSTEEEIALQDELFFVESAILNTGGITPMCDWVWLVDASETERISRVTERDHMPEAKVKAKIESQASEFDNFESRPVFVIQNDEGKEVLEEIRSALSLVIL